MPLQACPREWEFWFTVNDNRGYRPSDQNYKSTRQLIRMFADCIGMGGNVLLNVAPLEDGTIDTEQEKRPVVLSGPPIAESRIMNLLLSAYIDRSMLK